jgi:hypothetical protein
VLRFSELPKTHRGTVSCQGTILQTAEKLWFAKDCKGRSFSWPLKSFIFFIHAGFSPRGIGFLDFFARPVLYTLFPRP